MGDLPPEVVRNVVSHEPICTDGKHIVQLAIQGNVFFHSFIVWFLSLRIEERSRRTWDAVVHAFPCLPPKRWFTLLCNTLYTTYTALRRWALPTSGMGEEPDYAIHLTKKNRREVARSNFSIPARSRSRRSIGTENLRCLWDSMHNRHLVVWFDNYNQHRYGVNPMNPNLSLTATAVSILHTRPYDPFPGFPTLGEILDAIPNVVNKLTKALRKLRALCTEVVQWRLTDKDIRVPLDIQRRNVCSLQWKPFMLVGCNVSSTLGLIEMVESCLQIRRRALYHTPCLVDLNPHYRLHKLLYARNNVQYNVANRLQLIPPLFGIWHVYKYAVGVTYRMYLPILALIQHPMLRLGDDTVRVKGTPKLRQMETMFAALMISSQRVMDTLDHELQNPEPGCRTHILRALKVLLFEHIPCLFLIGELVRECNWCGRDDGTSIHAYDASAYGLLLLLCHTLGHEDTVEYIRCIMVSLLTWTPWHGTLQGAFFSEEYGEAMLSRLAAMVYRYRNATTVDDIMDLFLCVRPADVGARDLTASRIPKDYVARVAQQLSIVINTAGRNNVPFVRWTPKVLMIEPELDWDESYMFPCTFKDLGIRIETVLNDLALNTINTLVTATSRDAATEARMASVFEAESAYGVESKQRDLNRLREYMNMMRAPRPERPPRPDMDAFINIDEGHDEEERDRDNDDVIYVDEIEA